ncbi:MAG: pilus assembly protein TadG-related protein [Candidatus Nanopelagicales bacterium]
MRGLRQEQGSVTTLVIGMVPVLLGLVVVLTDLSVLYIHKRSLAAAADNAAVAGAQSVDLETFYTTSPSRLPLNCSASRRAISRQVGASKVDKRTPRITVVSTTCDGSTVGVQLRSQVILPFSQHFGVKPQVQVAGSARARSPLS